VAQIFPEWANKIQTYAAILAGLAILGIVGFFWYFGSPRYTDVGYRPHQPVAYDHELHAGTLEIDCRYCHSAVEISPHSNVPPTQTCMNCHTLIKTESEKLALIRSSWISKTPMEWIRVHNLPDYAYFDHSAHLAAGVGCASCHGNVAAMKEVMQMQPLSMGWCLNCHRDPGPHLRPVGEITNMRWIAPPDQDEISARVITEKNLNPPVDCSGCHR